MNNRNSKLPLWEKLEASARPKIRYWLPAAAVEEEDLRRELRALKERGFGGVEIVVLERLSPAIQQSEDGWGSGHWNETVAVIGDETQKLGMTMDIANGLGWPISSPAITTADDAAALYELTFGECRISPGEYYAGLLPEGRIARPEGTRTLVHVLAYLEKQDKVLTGDSYIDLMPYVEERKEGNFLKYQFPKSTTEGEWVLFAFYGQPAAQKTGGGRYYVTDHLSKAGSAACEAYWKEVFEKYTFPSMESVFCDSLEYEVSLDWTPELLEEFEKRRGYSLKPFLPFIGLTNLYPACDVPGYVLEDASLSEMVNHDYLETLTQCYCENHLAVLEKMAGSYGKTVRYQVGYNKPFEVERCPLFVSVPENEALGRPSLDYQKTMAAAVHYGRKDRYSFECAAEFGNSYGQDYEDLFWWIKRSLMAGMNAQVLHGASYSGGYRGVLSENGNVPGTQWPGYEAFSLMVSNYWNRTLSAEDARGCMDTVARLNMVFRKPVRVDCAIFRCSYSNDGMGSEFCLYDDGGKLSNAGYSYEFVSEYLLEGLAEKVETVAEMQEENAETVQSTWTEQREKKVMDVEGAGYKCLIIPRQKAVTISFLRLIEKLAGEGFPVIWQGERPEHAFFYGEWNSPQKRLKWTDIREEVWLMPGIWHVKDLQEIPDVLREKGVLPEIFLEGSMDIATAVRRAEEETYFILYGYNRVEYSPESPNEDETACSAVYRKGTVKGSYQRPGAVSRKKIRVGLKGRGNVCRCNPWSGGMEPEVFYYDAGTGYVWGNIFLEEDEMVILCMSDRKEFEPVQSPFGESSGEEGTEAFREIPKEISCPVILQGLTLEEFCPDKEGELSFLRSGFKPCGIRQTDVPQPPDSLPAGIKERWNIDKRPSEEPKKSGRQGEKREALVLFPWREMDARLEHFAGRGTYGGYVTLNEVFPKDRYILELGEVCDTFTVKVNGKKAPFPDQVMKRLELTGLLRAGRNELEIQVVSNLYNKVFPGNKKEQRLPSVYLPRNYGIWETEYKKVQLKILRYL